LAGGRGRFFAHANSIKNTIHLIASAQERRHSFFVHDKFDLMIEALFLCASKNTKAGVFSLSEKTAAPAFFASLFPLCPCCFCISCILFGKKTQVPRT
jgi:hypothetical protein